MVGVPCWHSMLAPIISQWTKTKNLTQKLFLKIRTAEVRRACGHGDRDSSTPSFNQGGEGRLWPPYTDVPTKFWKLQARLENNPKTPRNQKMLFCQDYLQLQINTVILVIFLDLTFTSSDHLRMFRYNLRNCLAKILKLEKTKVCGNYVHRRQEQF